MLELRDRIGSLDGGEPGERLGVVAVAPWRDQLAHALAGLGFTGREAIEAVDAVGADAGDNPDVAVLLRRSIQLLGRAG